MHKKPIINCFSTILSEIKYYSKKLKITLTLKISEQSKTTIIL